MKRSDPTEWAIFSHSRPRVIIARHVPLVLFGHSSSHSSHYDPRYEGP